MTKMIISTQCMENYGSEDEPYWKFKGGSEYFVSNVHECDMVDIIFDRAKSKIEVSNPFYIEYVLSYHIVEDNYLTEFEKSQLEYEGKILYPAEEITL